MCGLLTQRINCSLSYIAYRGQEQMFNVQANILVSEDPAAWSIFLHDILNSSLFIHLLQTAIKN